jgi:pyrrolidone-carboxylate peptidase
MCVLSSRPRLCGFAFSRRNVSCRTLYAVNYPVDTRTLLWGKASIDRYCETLLRKNPKYILGLGVYTGRGQHTLRLERVCTNRFRNTFVGGTVLEQLSLKGFLAPVQGAVFAESMGTSYCNYVSWRITSLIESGELCSKYSFVHIPKDMETEAAVSVVERMLMTLDAK